MKKYIIIAALLALSFRTGAQNLNPKVQVENDYSATFDAAARNGIGMSVPDSLLSFDYKFDYEVFTSPYKGAYDVSQFRMQNMPERRLSDGRSFILDMGAGYNLRPEMHLAWEPLRLGAFSLALSNVFDGFVGHYSAGDGYELNDGFRLSNRRASKSCTMSLDLGYDGVFSKIDDLRFGQSSFNSACADFSLSSILPDSGSSIFYSVDLSYRFGQDNLKGNGFERENLFSLAGSIGPEISGKYLALVDVGFDIDALGGTVSKTSVRYALTPHCAFTAGPVDLDLGLSLSYSGGFHVFPAIRASMPLLRDFLAVFAEIGGRDRLNSYAGFKFANPFFNPGFGIPSAYIERINTELGFRGHAAGSLQYEVKASWASNEGAPLETADFRMAAADYSLLTVDASLDWISERVDAGFDFLYRYSFLSEQARALEVFRLPGVNLDGHFMCNWRKRIYAGVDCRWQTSRRIEGTSYGAPAFFDLGVRAEYRIDRLWKVWLKGGNLLGQELWLNPYFAQKGASATIGFSLEF